MLHLFPLLLFFRHVVSPVFCTRCPLDPLGTRSLLLDCQLYSRGQDIPTNSWP
jgi:hypothetical protein